MNNDLIEKNRITAKKEIFLQVSADRTIFSMGLVNIVIGIGAQLNALEFNRNIQLVIAVFGAIFSISYFLMRWLKFPHMSLVSAVFTTLMVVPYAWTYARFLDRGLGDIALAPLTIYVAIVSIILIAPGSRGVVSLFQAVIFFGCFIFAIRFHLEKALYPISVVFGVTAAGAAGSVFLDRIFNNMFTTMVRAEFELLPPGFEQFAANHESSQLLVLTSDWRGYQNWTKNHDAKEVGWILEKYYELTSTLIYKHFPEIPHASDWIADELIIYLPLNTEDEKLRAVSAAVEFSRELLAQKKMLSTDGIAPPKIDVGIAFGEAILGLFGVAGRRKLTAVGPVLSDARLCQSKGKALRKELGDADRIIIQASLKPFVDSTIPGLAAIDHGIYFMVG